MSTPYAFMVILFIVGYLWYSFLMYIRGKAK